MPRMVWAAGNVRHQSSRMERASRPSVQRRSGHLQSRPTSPFFQSLPLNKLCEFWQVAPLPICFPPRWRIQKAVRKQGELFPQARPCPPCGHTAQERMVPFGSWHCVPRPLLCRVTPGQLLSRGCCQLLPLPKSTCVPHGWLARFPRSFFLASRTLIHPSMPQPPCSLECLCFS